MTTNRPTVVAPAAREEVISGGELEEVTGNLIRLIADEEDEETVNLMLGGHPAWYNRQIYTAVIKAAGYIMQRVQANSDQP